MDRGANVNARDENQEETPLMYAAGAGQFPVMNLLIAKGADVNAVAHTLDLQRRLNPTTTFANRTTGGFTALMFAARQDCAECAKVLLDAGANPNVSDRDGMTPLIIAAINGSFETGKVILDKGGDPNDGSLWETMEFRNFKEDTHVDPVLTSTIDPLTFVKALVEHGADPTRPYGKMRTTNRTQGTNFTQVTRTSALDRAMEGVDVDSIKFMLASAKARNIKFDPNAVLVAEIRAYSLVGPQIRPGGEELGKMVFRTVTVKDVADAINLAISYGADVNAPNAAGNTPLHLAAQQGADDVIQLLVAKGARVNVKNPAGLTPVDFAMGKGPRPVGRGGGMAPPAAAPQVHEATAALLRQLMAAPAGQTSAPDNRELLSAFSWVQ
jgi:ankyrin repeat protein